MVDTTATGRRGNRFPPTAKIIGLTLATAACVAIIVITMIYRRHGAGSLPSQPVAAEDADLSLENIFQSASRGNRRSWRLKAASAKFLESGSRMEFQRPELILYLKDQSTISLTADSGWLHTRSNDIEVNGHVQLNDRDYTLSTESLRYLHRRRVVLTDRPVTIKGPSLTLSAQSLWINLDTKTAILQGKVVGAFGGNPPQPPPPPSAPKG